MTDLTFLAGEALPAPEPQARERGRRPYAVYALQRVAGAIAVILLAYVITFVIVSVIPGNPIADALDNPQSGLSPAQVHHLEVFYGVSKPVFVRLWLSLSRFVRGDFGISLQTHLPVTQMIGTALPYTVKLSVLALLLSLLLAAAIAYGSQRLPWAWARGAVRSVPSLFLSVPNFIVGLLLIQLFSFQLHAFDVLDPSNFVGTLFAALTLAIPICAPLAEVLIANLDHESQQDYVLVARSRGLTEARLLARHLVKPSMLPAVTIAALIAGELMGGALITEEVFGRTGIGAVMYQAVSSQDTPVLQGVVSLAAVVFVAVNLVADLLAPLIDPRIELGRRTSPGGGAR